MREDGGTKVAAESSNLDGEVGVMKLSVARNRDVNVVRVEESRLTYPVLAAFYAEVRQIVEEGAHRLVINLEAVTYIDSAAIGCLIDDLIESREA